MYICMYNAQCTLYILLSLKIIDQYILLKKNTFKFYVLDISFVNCLVSNIKDKMVVPMLFKKITDFHTDHPSKMVEVRCVQRDREICI